MAVGEEFNKTAAYYDDWVQKALPCYGEVFAIILELLPTINDEQMTVLDLGAGTGLFSKHVLARLPKAHFVLWDVAEEMLNVAKERFARHSDQFEYVVDDYRRLDRIDNVDIVISSLSIHHLVDSDKQKLFNRIHDVCG